MKGDQMLPLLIGGAALVGGALWLFSGHDEHKANVPKSVVDAVAAALASGDPKVMHDIAAKLRADGYPNQAASLESAGTELSRSIHGTPKAKAGVAHEPIVGKGHSA